MDRSDGDLSPAECWALLATASVGRLALSVRALPLILPVRFVVEDASVVMGLGLLGMPASSVDDAVVAFAADEIDGRTATGWMVQLQGRIRLSPPAGTREGTGPSDDVRVVRLAPGRLTGNRFTLRPVDPDH